MPTPTDDERLDLLIEQRARIDDLEEQLQREAVRAQRANYQMKEVTNLLRETCDLIMDYATGGKGVRQADLIGKAVHIRERLCIYEHERSIHPTE